MTRPDSPGSRHSTRNEMRVAAGDFISWDTWSGRTTTYVVIGNDAHYYDDLWVGLRSADHHDAFHSCVPAGAEWATEEEVAEFIEESRSRWSDGHPAVPESALERWTTTLALRAGAERHASRESPLRRLDGLTSGDPPDLGL